MVVKIIFVVHIDRAVIPIICECDEIAGFGEGKDPHLSLISIGSATGYSHSMVAINFVVCYTDDRVFAGFYVVSDIGKGPETMNLRL